MKLRKHASHSSITKANLRKLKQLSSPNYDSSPRLNKNVVSISAFVNLSPEPKTQYPKMKTQREHKQSIVIFSRNQEVLEQYKTNTPRRLAS